jgi:hypothetical protein
MARAVSHSSLSQPIEPRIKTRCKWIPRVQYKGFQKYWDWKEKNTKNQHLNALRRCKK